MLLKRLKPVVLLHVGDVWRDGETRKGKKGEQQSLWIQLIIAVKLVQSNRLQSSWHSHWKREMRCVCTTRRGRKLTFWDNIKMKTLSVGVTWLYNKEKIWNKASTENNITSKLHRRLESECFFACRSNSKQLLLLIPSSVLAANTQSDALKLPTRRRRVWFLIFSCFCIFLGK